MINHFLEEYPQYQIAENWHLRKRYNAIRKSSDWLKFRKYNSYKGKVGTVAKNKLHRRFRTS
ncbi:hypothetical protein ACI3RH_14750, partial [Lactococcus lactis]